MKLSEAQTYQLRKLAGKTLMPADYDRREGQYCSIPYVREQRTFDALERKGLIVWRSVDEPGISQNGFRLTELGRQQVK